MLVARFFLSERIVLLTLIPAFELTSAAESFEEVEGGTTEAQDVEEDETTASAAKGKHEEFGETSWAPIYTFFSFGFPMGAKKPESEQNGWFGMKSAHHLGYGEFDARSGYLENG